MYSFLAADRWRFADNLPLFLLPKESRPGFRWLRWPRLLPVDPESRVVLGVQSLKFWRLRVSGLGRRVQGVGFAGSRSQEGF